MIQLFDKCYRLFIRAGSSLQSPFLLAVRLYWGWQFMETGWGKLTDIGKVTDFFTDLGIPAPALNAYFVSAVEFGGGVFLILGLGSRLIAVPLVIDMLVAYVTADREALFSIFSNPDKFTAASPYTFLVASLIVLIFGPGRFRWMRFWQREGGQERSTYCRRRVASGRAELAPLAHLRV